MKDWNLLFWRIFSACCQARKTVVSSVTSQCRPNTESGKDLIEPVQETISTDLHRNRSTLSGYDGLYKAQPSNLWTLNADVPGTRVTRSPNPPEEEGKWISVAVSYYRWTLQPRRLIYGEEYLEKKASSGQTAQLSFEQLLKVSQLRGLD